MTATRDTAPLAATVVPSFTDRAALLTGKTFYRVLDIPNVRHRRGKGATDAVLLRRLLSLDYLIERPSLT